MGCDTMFEPAREQSNDVIRKNVKNEAGLREHAVNLLSRRDYSRQELARKLKVQAENPQDIDGILQWLEGLGYINDARYAQSFSRMSIAKGRGPVRIANELRQKGISADFIDIALEQIEQDWFALASDVAGRKFSLPINDYKQRAKVSRYLQYRGFTSEHIRHLFI